MSERGQLQELSADKLSTSSCGLSLARHRGAELFMLRKNKGQGSWGLRTLYLILGKLLNLLLGALEGRVCVCVHTCVSVCSRVCASVPVYECSRVRVCICVCARAL